MTTVPVNFRAFVLADAAIARKVDDRMHQDHVPQARDLKKRPFIWYRKRAALGSETLDSSAGEDAFEVTFDVECVAFSAREKDELVDLVRARCSCYRGTFGNSTCQGTFVIDEDDDYSPQAIGDDAGAFVGVMGVRVMGAV